MQGGARPIRILAALLLMGLVMAAIADRALPAGSGERAVLKAKIKHAALALGLMVSAGPAAEQALPPPRPAVIGINLSGVSVFGSTVPFANLAIGAEWNDTGWHHLTDDHLDKDGNLLSLPADGRVTRFLLVPPTGPEGFDARCTFTGEGRLEITGAPGPIRPGPHSLSFHLVNERGKASLPWLTLTGFDPARPLRNLDCRDVRTDPAARFRPEFLRFLHGFKVVRFMDWQNANNNTAVAWRNRHLPGISLATDRDGVAIEDMMLLTREIGADPWFTVPWNADNEYITRFAQLVRSQLPAGRSVYVEVGNEVWNGSFSAAQQAVKEGVARGLATNPSEAGIRRYAQRTAEVMRLWEAVFAGRRGLVRVLSTQTDQPWLAESALSFGDTAQHVDALATAPYFGGLLVGKGNTRESSLASMRTSLAATFNGMVANRRIAAAHGKRYLGYEGGPGPVIPEQEALMVQLQHDPEMYALTSALLTGWAQRAGDVLCLYNSVSRPNAWGMWGLAEWENDTPAEAPKLTAVRDFMAKARPAPRPASSQPIAP